MPSLNQILNVSSKEWPRILAAWSITFLVKFGFIIGWSVLMATFLSKIGIEYLPILFFTNAIFVMLGTLFFQQFIHRIRREVLIAFTVIFAALFLMSSTLFIETNLLVFFILLIISESVLLAQLGILISLYNEDFFTPLESQRTFPIIESAETLGGIAGGLLLAFFAHQIPAYKFILIWAIALILILPIVLRFNPKQIEIPRLESKDDEERLPFKARFKGIKNIPFFKGLMFALLLHFAMMNIIEFQYTKAIQQEIYSLQEQTIVMESEVSLAAETDAEFYEQAMTQKLGYLHILFSSAALVIQLILASRVITSFGIVSSLIFHPFITFLNLIGLSLRFNLFTAVFTRGSYELTGFIFKSSYDASYYAIPEEKRGDAKEIMQGLIKPLGAILGTVFLALIALLTSGPTQTILLNILLGIMSIIMVFILINLHKKYTNLSEQHLSKKTSLPTRINAIEILAQNGHSFNLTSLQKILERESEPEIIRLKIIETLGERRASESAHVLMSLLSNKSAKIRLSAVLALLRFNSLQKISLSHSFTRYTLIDQLKNSLKTEKNDKIAESLVQLFYKISPETLISFLMESIESKGKNQAVFIRMLKLFPDVNLKYYLEPYLNGKDHELRAASIIALWQFKEMRPQLIHCLEQWLKSRKIPLLKLGITCVGDLQIEEFRPALCRALKHTDSEVQDLTILALSRMQDSVAIPRLVERLADPLHAWFHEESIILESLPEKLRINTERLLHIHVMDRIRDLLQYEKTLKHSLKKDVLSLLQAFYLKINAHYEVEKLQTKLDSYGEVKI